MLRYYRKANIGWNGLTVDVASPPKSKEQSIAELRIDDPYYQPTEPSAAPDQSNLFVGCHSVEPPAAPDQSNLFVDCRPVEPPTAPDQSNLFFEVHIIIIRGKTPSERFASRQSFFFDSFTALLSARSRRGETARFGLLFELCNRLDCAPDVMTYYRYYESVIEEEFFSLPLGWHMPTKELSRLESYVVPRKDQDLPFPESNDNGSIVGSMQGNKFNIEEIEKVLKPPTSP